MQGLGDTLIIIYIYCQFDCDLIVRLNFHGDELHPLGGSEMGAKLRAEAISHLEEVIFCDISKETNYVKHDA